LSERLDERRKMTERRQMLDYLMSSVGMDQEEPERVLLDDDLWLLEPDMRYPLYGEEAVRQWEGVVRFVRELNHMSHHFSGFPEAMRMLIGDARVRAEEAFEACERAGGR
jgi:hypothetical protein